MRDASKTQRRSRFAKCGGRDATDCCLLREKARCKLALAASTASGRNARAWRRVDTTDYLLQTLNVVAERIAVVVLEYVGLPVEDAFAS